MTPYGLKQIQVDILWYIYCAFRKFYPIRKLRSNLMDIKIQFIYPNFVIYRVFIDQGLNVFFQLYYNDLGSENIFKIWWTSFFLENIGKKSNTEMLSSMVYHFKKIGSRFFLNIWIYFNALKIIPEFSGLQGKIFPGKSGNFFIKVKKII